MMKKFIPLAIFLIAFSSAGLLMFPTNPEDSKFQKALEDYFSEYWKFYPTAATLAGYHNYDNRLEDFSEKSLEKYHEVLDNSNQEFVAKIDKNRLSNEVLIDYEIMIDVLDLELLKVENLVPWEYNPVFYNEIFINCIKSLFSKEFAPLEERAKNAVERLKDLAKFIKQAKENLKTPPQVFTETAINQFPGIMDFYKNELPEIIAKAPADSQSKLRDGLAKVIPAFENYQNFLKNELLPRSTGNFRIGAQAHTRLLRLTLQHDLTLQDIINQAQPDNNNIRMKMFFTCVPFYEIMDPRIDLQNPPPSLTKDQLYNEVISHVFNRIKGEHVTKDEYISRVRDSAAEIKEFISKNDLISLPDVDIDIQPMPVYSRGITLSHIISPGIYESTGTPYVEVSPLSEGWNEEQIQSFLEEYNNSYLYFWTARNVYPGEFVPLLFTGKNASFVRKFYPNMALIKSWPVFVEEMLVTSGFGNYDLRLRLNQLKNLLKAVIDFQLDLNIHQGDMTKDLALRIMTITGFQTQAEAERNWNRIILKPGAATFVYVGYKEIMEMEKRQRELKGDSFDKKEFLEKLLSCGALPLRHLRKKILEQ